jgi:hypothetical protein
VIPLATFAHSSRWWRDKSLRWNVFWVVITGSTHVVSGYDASLFGSLLAVPSVSPH